MGGAGVAAKEAAAAAPMASVGAPADKGPLGAPGCLRRWRRARPASPCEIMPCHCSAEREFVMKLQTRHCSCLAVRGTSDMVADAEK